MGKIRFLRVIQIVRRDDSKGFVVLQRRWVVERTFSWFGRKRSLAKTAKTLPKPWLPSLPTRSIQLALRRLARASVVNSTTTVGNGR